MRCATRCTVGDDDSLRPSSARQRIAQQRCRATTALRPVSRLRDDGEMDETGDVLTGANFAAVAAGQSRDDSTAQLVCLLGQCAGRIFTLSKRPLLIGRTADAEIRVLGDDVSRRHAQVSWADHGFVIEDLNSRNGISVNGVAVRRHTLAVGDRIQIASSAVLVYAEPDELELRTQRLQTLEMMSKLAATLSHDFKNMLFIIAANTQLIQEIAKARYANDDALCSAIQDVAHATTTATGLTQRLLEFVRRRGDATSPSVAVDVASVVDDATSLVRRGFAHNVRLEVDVAAGISVYGDPVELTQIVSNLVLNAQQAMPNGGSIKVHAHMARLSRSEALARHLPSEGDYVELRVTDTGIGMDLSTQARIFEPFFTTRPDTGSGLGLSSVYGLVRSRGGNVLVHSTPGGGATFRVLLPVPPAQSASDRGTDRLTARISLDALR